MCHVITNLEVALLLRVDERAVRVGEQLLVARDLRLGVERAAQQVANLRLQRGARGAREPREGAAPAARERREASCRGVTGR